MHNFFLSSFSFFKLQRLGRKNVSFHGFTFYFFTNSLPFSLSLNSLSFIILILGEIYGIYGSSHEIQVMYFAEWRPFYIQILFPKIAQHCDSFLQVTITPRIKMKGFFRLALSRNNIISQDTSALTSKETWTSCISIQSTGWYHTQIYHTGLLSSSIPP